MDEVARILHRSVDACWIEWARISLYGLVLTEFRGNLKKLESVLTKIDNERGPNVERILAAIRPSQII